MKGLNDGVLTVDTSQAKHHTRLHPEISGPYLIMWRGQLGGWKPSPHTLMLGNQLYQQKVHGLVTDQNPKEVAVVNPNSGEWETVWVEAGEEGVANQRRVTDKKCPKCGIVVEDVEREGKTIGFYCPECDVFYTNAEEDTTHSSSENLEEADIDG